MQSPSSREPLATRDICLRGTCGSRGSADITKISVAYLGAIVPAVHTVDSLGEFSAAPLVDAACVGPNPIDAILASQVVALLDLLPSFRLKEVSSLNLLEAHFAIFPAM